MPSEQQTVACMGVTSEGRDLGRSHGVYIPVTANTQCSLPHFRIKHGILQVNSSLRVYHHSQVGMIISMRPCL